MADTARWNGSSWTTLTTLQRWSGSAWTGIQNIRRWSGSAWTLVWNSFSASISPNSASGSIVAAGLCTSNSVTCIPSGGIGPFTYSWSVTNGITITSPSSASTTFSHFFVGTPPQGVSGVATCTVTDTGSSQQLHPTCSVTLSYT